MIPSLVIMLRETLEVSLIIGIIFSYLHRTSQPMFKKTVWLAIITGIGLSLISGLFLNNIAGGFTGKAEEIFEGLIMLAGASLLTFMIIWMLRQKNISQKLEQDVSQQIYKASTWGLFFLVLVTILREGVETVIFLQATSFSLE